MVTTSKERVPTNTDPRINRRIAEEAEQRVAYFRAYPHRIAERLRQLDEEWDIERMLETGASTISLVGFALAILKRRKRWLVLPLAVQSFLLQHALQGWCPPLPILRRMGFRTQYEIESERHELLMIAERGSEAERPID